MKTFGRRVAINCTSIPESRVSQAVLSKSERRVRKEWVGKERRAAPQYQEPNHDTRKALFSGITFYAVLAVVIAMSVSVGWSVGSDLFGSINEALQIVGK